MPRLFVGLAMPEPIIDALSALQSGVEGARWRPLENFHLTLAFIGETDRHGFSDAVEALSQIDAPAFDLKLSGVGSFGERSPRALWAGAAPNPDLLHLQSKVETALRRKGFNLEKRKFTPHVTLAYLKGARRESIERYCLSHSLFSTNPFPVDAFHLYSSRLGNSASHYEIEASYSLSSSR
ncbi:MAG: RNA 2',3'-cyclic phosphodiesterase [Hyphococcus sp.]